MKYYSNFLFVMDEIKRNIIPHHGGERGVGVNRNFSRPLRNFGMRHPQHVQDTRTVVIVVYSAMKSLDIARRMHFILK
jgi:hypothetical protein